MQPVWVKLREERLRPLQLVERELAAAAGGDRDDDLGDPVGMRRAAGHVDHRQAGLGAVVRAEEAAVRALEELQALLSDGLGAVAGMPPQVAQSPIATT